MGFWSPMHLHGFQCPTPESKVDPGIFFHEALTTLSAINWVARHHAFPNARIAIMCDNQNTVDMFNSLHARTPALNPILLTAVDLMIEFQFKLRVFWIEGEQNTVADALSRFDNARALDMEPSLIISAFTPPRLTLGSEKK
ncbi:hypothetical protein BOTBODRAFT_122606 [Botryobasidium botryosum FD-172 SS1]|uniref:RNase H type-1 domain-containing protein n=1 Tax=Botryobasidium botryosum (strain FD-172 SS1) TaxID=930990 RepID=A0A067M0Z3_BOTB1|nr:hypothetical protein BOTBODRAFT_122606 [Botryobasidium botryosum FD-172 SS1]